MAKPNAAEAELARLRQEWLNFFRGLGIEELAPAEEREKMERLEKALGEVFLFEAQLRLAEARGFKDEWVRLMLGGSSE